MLMGGLHLSSRKHANLTWDVCYDLMLTGNGRELLAELTAEGVRVRLRLRTLPRYSGYDLGPYCSQQLRQRHHLCGQTLLTKDGVRSQIKSCCCGVFF